MGISAEMAQESLTRLLCRKIEEKLKKYPESAKALKELGMEMLRELPGIPNWVDEYWQMFCQ